VHQLMMGGWMVICEVVTLILLAVCPKQVEFSLCRYVFDPVVVHIKGF